MRFVFTSYDFTAHHVKLLYGLGVGIQKSSGGAHHVLITDEAEPQLEADVVLGINTARPEALPANIRYISWVQDIINWPKESAPSQIQLYEGQARSGDIIYTLGDGRVVGVNEKDPHWRGSLSSGVDERLFGRPHLEPDIDLSLSAYIPPSLSSWAKLSDPWVQLLADGIKEGYQPLRGELDPLGMLEQIKQYLLARVTNTEECLAAFDRNLQRVKWMVVEYSRILDRLAMVKLMLSVSGNCELRGANWNWYPQLINWWKPHTNIPEILYQTYQRSKINLHINQTGFAIHARVLDCMALGCFIMSHATVRDCPGQLTEYFTPDVHYGVFTPEDFKEQARYWLDNKQARLKVINEAREAVRAEHLWEHRGARVLKDLRED
jgi:glycosyltransferase involved in cell wall biosynthesis